jgi:two-component system, cell cycle response regulator DivK
MNWTDSGVAGRVFEKINEPFIFVPVSVSVRNPDYRPALISAAWRRLCRVSGRQQGDVRMARTVLIVEDNELNMKLFHDLLEAHGYSTVATRNGVEAIELARTYRPDLILMDIQLPEVSGLEVTKWIKDDPDLHAIPVVAVTAFAMKGDEERIRQGGCEAYLSKPISVAKFMETIRRFLGTPDLGSDEYAARDYAHAAVDKLAAQPELTDTQFGAADGDGR